MLINSLVQLQTICERVTETCKAENHELDLDVLMEKDDSGDYIVPPVHCQRNHEEHSQDLALQYEDRGGHVDGLGTNYHIAVPIKDFDVYSDNKIAFFHILKLTFRLFHRVIHSNVGIFNNKF